MTQHHFISILRADKLREILIQYRVSNRITREDFAMLSDVSPSTLKAIEHGLSDPKLSTVNKIISALGAAYYD